MLSPSAGVGPATRLWDAPGLRLMRVEAGRFSALVAARRWVVGEPLEGFKRCVGLAGAVEMWLDVPASPPLAES
jgi:hypothetical protein